ncbi:hypothetical protein RCH14_004570 [Massilia sp. MP_M2]|uniref:hypothetical protein n=1 Tax=Massilia sp. MP_M2 TaxID=3071713 RepID=UPI00319DC77A
MMRFERIDKLVVQHDFSFQAWSDRYSKGVWAALGTLENEVDTVRDLSSAGDGDMIPAMEYIDSAQWLPYATGRTLAEAMSKLEAILAGLPADQLARGTDWSGLVFEAIGVLRHAEQASMTYGGIDGTLSRLPASFEDALAQAQSSSQT